MSAYFFLELSTIFNHKHLGTKTVKDLTIDPLVFCWRLLSALDEVIADSLDANHYINAVERHRNFHC
ncbi:MAG: hypothetical protein ACSLEL_01795 [Candidatus Malihini olakiniferum]